MGPVSGFFKLKKSFILKIIYGNLLNFNKFLSNNLKLCVSWCLRAFVAVAPEGHKDTKAQRYTKKIGNKIGKY